MKPMIWHPEEHDRDVNAYLEQVNHAPYPTIAFAIFASICVVTLLILVGSI